MQATPNKRIITTRTLVLIAVLSALVFVLSLLEIRIPLPGSDSSRLHLGNVMCLTSGVLFGPWIGGLAAGFGSMFYDFTNPAYAPEFWITFLTKFAMGCVAGFVSRGLGMRLHSIPRALLAGIAGQLCYIALYLGKTVIMQRLVYGLQDWLAIGTIVAGKAAISATNGLIAVIACTILAPALRAALDASGLFKQQSKQGAPR